MRFGQQWPPFWIAAENANRLLCQHIFETTGKNSLNGLFGLNNALHMVAKKGNVEVCKFIVNYLEDKNPIDNFGLTPFHYAAKNGHANVCVVLMRNLLNKNPGNRDGWTPLHEAAKYGKIEVCKVILFF